MEYCEARGNQRRKTARAWRLRQQSRELRHSQRLVMLCVQLLALMDARNSTEKETHTLN